MLVLWGNVAISMGRESPSQAICPGYIVNFIRTKGGQYISDTLKLFLDETSHLLCGTILAPLSSCFTPLEKILPVIKICVSNSSLHLKSVLIGQG